MLYDREISLNVRLQTPIQAATTPTDELNDNIIISGLRIVFNILKTEAVSTNTANIKVYNLSRDNRNVLNDFGDRIRLFAGYRLNGGEQLLFVGDTTKVSHFAQPPEFISTFEVIDGERQLNNSIITVSYGANTPIRSVVENIAALMSTDIQYFAPTENLVYPYGYKNSGRASIILNEVVEALGLKYSVQNGNLIISNDQGILTPIFEINENTGMIGSPERFTNVRDKLYIKGYKNGWKVRCLLRPDILPGNRIRLRSTRLDLDGEFIVISIRHTGDNYSDDFQSLLEVVAP